jgi:hypothetical protein
VIEHWDGVRWSNIPFAGGASYSFTFNTIAAVTTTDAWVVGGFETSRTRTHAFIAPVIEHRSSYRALGWHALEQRYQPYDLDA